MCMLSIKTFKSKGQHKQSARSLSAKGTLSSGSRPHTKDPLYPGRPRYDNSELREERGRGKSGKDLASDQVGWSLQRHTYACKYRHANRDRKVAWKMYVCLLQPCKSPKTHSKYQFPHTRPVLPGFGLALFFSWWRNRARPLMPNPHLIPSPSTKGLVRLVEANGAPASFYQKWTEQHTLLLKANAASSSLPSAAVESMASHWVIRSTARWPSVQLAHICSECDSWGWGILNRLQISALRRGCYMEVRDKAGPACLSR